VGSWMAATPSQVGHTERTSREAEDRRESDQSPSTALRAGAVLGDGWAVHMGKGLTGTRSLHRKHGPDMKGRGSVPTSLEAIAEVAAEASVPEACPEQRRREPGAEKPHAGILRQAQYRSVRGEGGQPPSLPRQAASAQNRREERQW